MLLCSATFFKINFNELDYSLEKKKKTGCAFLSSIKTLNSMLLYNVFSTLYKVKEFKTAFPADG